MRHYIIYWKQHVIFFVSIVIILSLMFPIQLLLGAEYYTSNPWGYTDQSWYHLIHTRNFIFLHGILLIFAAIWILWSGWKKPLINSFIGLINSALITTLIFLIVRLNWLYNCQDFCGFGTVFFMPFVLFGMFCISLFFPSK